MTTTRVVRPQFNYHKHRLELLCLRCPVPGGCKESDPLCRLKRAKRLLRAVRACWTECSYAGSDAD